MIHTIKVVYYCTTITQPIKNNGTLVEHQTILKFIDLLYIHLKDKNKVIYQHVLYKTDSFKR